MELNRIRMFPILAAIPFLAGCWYLLPFLLRKLAQHRLRTLCRARRTIALTYDDGPGEVLTPRLLDLLDQHGVKASFFPLGRNAQANPSTVLRAIQQGHEVGSHSFDHLNAWRHSPGRVAQDVESGLEIVRELGGAWWRFRPPNGKLTLAGLLQGAIRGLKIAWWTIDSRDSWGRGSVDDILKQIESEGGGVILMHDFDTYHRSPKTPTHIDHTLLLTQSIIEFAQKGRFTLVPLSQLTDASPTRVHPNGNAPTPAHPPIPSAQLPHTQPT